VLEHFSLGPCGSKRAHVAEAAHGEATRTRKSRPQVGGQPLDDFRATTTAAIPLAGLALQDLATDLPVNLDQLRVDRPRSPRLSAADATLDVLEKLLVALGRSRLSRRRSRKLRHKAPKPPDWDLVDLNTTRPKRYAALGMGGDRGGS